jgi:hypothetical protein
MLQKGQIAKLESPEVTPGTIATNSLDPNQIPSSMRLWG